MVVPRARNSDLPSRAGSIFEPLEVLKSTLRALQLAGVLAIGGFMFFYGRESFLGLRVSHNVADLGFGTGDFILGTSMLLLKHLIATVAFLIAFAVLVFHDLKPKWLGLVRTARMSANGVLVGVCLSTSIVLGLFQIPLSKIDNVLVTTDD